MEAIMNSIREPAHSGSVNFKLAKVDPQLFKNMFSFEIYKAFRAVVKNKYGNFVLQTAFQNLKRSRRFTCMKVLEYLHKVDPKLHN